MKLFSTIKSDLSRLDNPTVASFLRWYFFPQGSMFHHCVWFRILEKCKEHRVLRYTIGVPVYFVERHWAILYGVHANANIPVGPGLRIVHGDGVFLNCRYIGENFTVYPNVTIGGGGVIIPKTFLPLRIM